MSPHRDDRVELEPVTCWPLICGATGLVAVLALSVGVVWAFNAIRPGMPEPPASMRGADDLGLLSVSVVPEAAPAPFREERQVIQRPTPPMPAPLSAWPAYRKPTNLAELPEAERFIHLELVGPPKPRPEPSAVAERAARNEPTLRALLWKESRELTLIQNDPGERARSRNPIAQVKNEKAPLTASIRAFISKRPDLRGLPLAAEKDCLTSKEAGTLLNDISLKVRRLQASRDGRSRRIPSEENLDLSEQEIDRGMDTYLSRAKKDFADKPLAIGPLMQMFQIEALPLRTALVETLAAFSSKESSQALAKLAVFDLSPQVRYDAINALKKRKPAEVRPVFLAAFRHVWAPAADHAAHALVEIGDHEARGPLKKLLEAPPPDAPYQKDGKWHQRELVRVNHLANCFLCHSPSTEGPDRGKDSVFATVPVPGQRLPEVYYASRIRRASPSFIRADVVYFRQDFSVMHAVKDAKPWPEVQRFDYLVREKPLTDRQLVAARAAGRRKAPGDYPQLRAVKDALTELNRLPLVAAKK